MPNGQRPPARARDSEPRPGGPDDATSPAGFESLVKDMRHEVRRIRDGLGRIVRIEWLRLQARGLDVLFRTALILCLFGFCFAASIAAAILLANGIRDALFDWSQATWIGNLGAGIGILAIAIGVGLAFRARLRMGFVRKAARDRQDTT